jgi:dCMP deaminase
MNDAAIRTIMRAAYDAAENSTDRITRNGSVLVNYDGCILMTGFNHHVDGYGQEEEHHDRPLKYSLTEHAERDVIFKAAREQLRTRGNTMVANWVACPDCARAIVIAGISTVICHKQCMDRTPPRWEEMVNLGLDMLKRGGVQVIQWDGKVGRVSNLNNGEMWSP